MRLCASFRMHSSESHRSAARAPGKLCLVASKKNRKNIDRGVNLWYPALEVD